MNSQTLDKIFTPDSIAVIGASDEEGSVGYRLLRNLIGVGYRGVVYPVNPKHMSIQGARAEKIQDLIRYQKQCSRQKNSKY